VGGRFWGYPFLAKPFVLTEGACLYQASLGRLRSRLRLGYPPTPGVWVACGVVRDLICIVRAFMICELGEVAPE